jgi:hypothetical protein
LLSISVAVGSEAGAVTGLEGGIVVESALVEEGSSRVEAFLFLLGLSFFDLEEECEEEAIVGA